MHLHGCSIDVSLNQHVTGWGSFAPLCIYVFFFYQRARKGVSQCGSRSEAEHMYVVQYQACTGRLSQW